MHRLGYLWTFHSPVRPFLDEKSNLKSWKSFHSKPSTRLVPSDFSDLSRAHETRFIRSLCIRHECQSTRWTSTINICFCINEMESGRIGELIGRNVLGVLHWISWSGEHGSKVLIKPSDAHRSRQLKRSRFQGMRAEMPLQCWVRWKLRVNAFLGWENIKFPSVRVYRNLCLYSTAYNIEIKPTLSLSLSLSFFFSNDTQTTNNKAICHRFINFQDDDRVQRVGGERVEEGRNRLVHAKVHGSEIKRSFFR